MGDLVAKSLVSATAEGSTVLYRLLETTRAYGLERLAESPERDTVVERHALYSVDSLEAGDARPQKPKSQRRPARAADRGSTHDC
jgi:predicted ATPase